jgi:hypothetical protein
MMGAGGLFSQAAVVGLAHSFGIRIVKPIHDAGPWRLNVISRRNASAREVQGVAVGVVPDAQRRRRNALVENYQQAWGTPPGTIPPG